MTESDITAKDAEESGNFILAELLRREAKRSGWSEATMRSGNTIVCLTQILSEILLEERPNVKKPMTDTQPEMFAASDENSVRLERFFARFLDFNVLSVGCTSHLNHISVNLSLPDALRLARYLASAFGYTLSLDDPGTEGQVARRIAAKEKQIKRPESQNSPQSTPESPEAEIRNPWPCVCSSSKPGKIPPPWENPEEKEIIQ